MIKGVEFNKKNENPFYGMSHTLRLFQNASKGVVPTESQMKACLKECEDVNQKALLFSILFSIGDIVGRQHNIFDTKVESGGNSQREIFRDNIIPFLVENTKKKDYPTLIELIVEYTVMDNILANRVKTVKGKTTVVKELDMVSLFGINVVADYASKIINKGTKFQKICLAKFLTRPRFSKRAGNKRMLTETVRVMTLKSELWKRISDNCKLPYEDKVSYIDFSGLIAWKQKHNNHLESRLFSTGDIKDFDKEQFIKWLDMLPAGARFRVRNRVMYSKNEDGGFKWKELQSWYKEWESYKETKQKEQRELQVKVDAGIATDADKAKLNKVKKEAKVTVGGDSFQKMFKDFINGNLEAIKMQSIMDKINLPYNNLVFVDDSASMNWGSSHSHGFTPFQFAAFMATICMMKNPDSDARDIIGLFSRNCRLFNGIQYVDTRANSLLASQIKKVKRQPILNPSYDFNQNLSRMSQFLKAHQKGSTTNINSVMSTLTTWALQDRNNLEDLQRYPVWTFISDGNFNNKATVANSILDMFRHLENKLGFKPFIILIDVAHNTSANITQFEGVDNVMMIPPNPAAIELFLTNFRDMDVYDVYTPLLSIYRSKRYAPVRNFIYDAHAKKTAKKAELIK